jgi:hypothetical protein
MDRSVPLFAIVLGLICPQILAHHSRAEFTGDVIELEGELLEVDWVSPHPRFKLRISRVPAEDWEIQIFGGVATLGRAGIDESFFTIGDRVTVAGLVSTRRQNLLLGSNALLTSGLEAVLDYNVGPHWSGDYIGGQGGERVDESALSRAAAEDRGFFRVWSIPSTETAIGTMLASRPDFTEAGLAARENWDVTDNPMTRCEETWMPFMMLTAQPRELIDNGSNLLLRVPHLAGGSRTIYLDALPSGLASSRSRMGRSVGRWEGNTLVVETDSMDAPAFDPFGSMQSPAMQTTERFALSDDQSRLDYEIVMRDPIAFRGPATFKFQYLALGEVYPGPQCQ